ncbi:transposase mutator type [Actinobacteria bacterium OK074]|nr:transposase mutator type [Actinobacteria bacterium OK074]
MAATIRTISARTTGEQVRIQPDVVADMLGRQFPQAKKMLLDAAGDITAFAGFPPAHGKKIWSTNPLERLNREIRRRADVVQVFPNPARTAHHPTTGIETAAVTAPPSGT